MTRNEEGSGVMTPGSRFHTMHKHSQIILLTKSKLDQSRPMVEMNDKVKEGSDSSKKRKKNGGDGIQSMVVVTLGGRNEGNIKSYTYIRPIPVHPRHLCRLIPAWHPMVSVASRRLFILVGLLCCNGNHNPFLEPGRRRTGGKDGT
jgi:hypothetical protein